MDNNTNNRDFKVLSDREHVLCRPGMYLGSVTTTEREQWLYNKDTDTFKFGVVKVVPALLKCASELIDNSIDVAIDTNFKFATKIKINVTNKSIEVIDDGIGIPCTPPEGIDSKDPSQTCACLAWTKLKAGTSFDDSRKKIGTNGVGSSCVNVFSKLFIGYSDDGKHAQKIECTDNMSNIKASKVTKSSGKSGVTVYCEPDLERFGMSEIDKTHIDLIYQRLVNLAICYPKIKFIFNGERVVVNEKKFAQMFSSNAIIDSTDNATICVFPNEYDEFKFYSCVNGIDTSRGGTHVDYVTMEIANRIRDKLVKKHKSIRPGDVKNKICVSVMFTDFVNPQFDAQTKENLANANADIIKHLNGKFDFDKFTKDILKNSAIIDPIVETFKIKEELKARQELKKVKKIKVKSDKYMSPSAGTGNRYLFLCEGQCLENNTEVFSIAENKSIKIKDLNIGDLVLSHTQKIQQVIGKSSSLKPCFKIRTKTGKEVICSSEHRWFVFDTISKTFKFKKTKNLNLKTDKLVSNKLKYGFVLSKIRIESWTGPESEKYKFKMFGENFEVATSAEHKFIVFDEIKQEFIVKRVKDIDVINDKMVLLASN